MDRVAQRSVSNAQLVTAAAQAESGSSLAACRPDLSGKSSKKTQDTILYVVGELTRGGKIELFKDLDKEKAVIGITNFDGNVLGAGKNAVIDAISIEVGVSADGSEGPTEVEYGALKADSAIQAAMFTFEVDGFPIIQLPVFEAHNPNTTRTNDEKYRGLGHLPVIEAQKPLTAEFEFANGVSPDTTGGKKHYVRVALRANMTVSR